MQRLSDYGWSALYVAGVVVIVVIRLTGSLRVRWTKGEHAAQQWLQNFDEALDHLDSPQSTL